MSYVICYYVFGILRMSRRQVNKEMELTKLSFSRS